MKKTILKAIIATCLVPFFTNATHQLGGEIYYDHIADIDSNQSTYLITVVTYNDVGLSQLNILDVSYTSSCDPGGVMTVNLVQNGGIFQYNGCISSATIEDALYQGVVTMPKRCSDWAFNYTSPCCLPGPYQNVIYGTINYSFSLTATLNNLNQNNSSPRYQDPPSHTLCQSTNNFYWRQRATEPDMDSLVYRIIDPVHQWNQGYSRQNPFGSPGGMITDSISGVYAFQPAFTGLFLLLSSVEDYRQDTLTGSTIMVGSIQRFVTVYITPNCDLAQMDWGINVNDSLINVPMEVNCGATRIGLKASSKIDCSTLVNTDFFIHQPNGNILPIIGAQGNCLNGLSDSIFLDLHMPIQQNGDHYLISKQGFDGNTIISACGFELAQNDTTLIQVKSCNNVSSVEEETSFSLEVFPNPVYNYLEITGLKPNSKNRRIYSIFSSHGKLVLTNVLEREIDVSSLAPGLYFLEVKGSGNIASHIFSKL